MFIINFYLNMFRAHYAHLQEIKDPVTEFGVLFWFCWMWLVAVVERCLVGCEHCVNNKHLIVASCWFFSLHTLFTMHGHRNLKRQKILVFSTNVFHLIRSLMQSFQFVQVISLIP